MLCHPAWFQVPLSPDRRCFLYLTTVLLLQAQQQSRQGVGCCWRCLQLGLATAGSCESTQSRTPPKGCSDSSASAASLCSASRGPAEKAAAAITLMQLSQTWNPRAVLGILVCSDWRGSEGCGSVPLLAKALASLLGLCSLFPGLLQTRAEAGAGHCHVPQHGCERSKPLHTDQGAGTPLHLC